MWRQDLPIRPSSRTDPGKISASCAENMDNASEFRCAANLMMMITFIRIIIFHISGGAGSVLTRTLPLNARLKKSSMWECAGISLIFTLQNGIEYMRERQAGFTAGVTTSVTLSGLALSGMILLPVLKDESRLKSEQEASDNRKMLLNAARNGDQSAIETLTLDDIDIYSQVSRRLANEDVFSIVDTYFMPYGVECDLYSIMGEILAVRHRTNSATGVELYQMKLNVNEMQFDVCVPAEEVMGEPEIGRRFKGTIWLQGYINF